MLKPFVPLWVLITGGSVVQLLWAVFTETLFELAEVLLPTGLAVAVMMSFALRLVEDTGKDQKPSAPNVAVPSNVVLFLYTLITVPAASADAPEIAVEFVRIGPNTVGAAAKTGVKPPV